MIRETNTDGFRSDLKEGKTLVVDFWAPWCGPCRMIAPVLEELSESYTDRAEFVKVNVDENAELSQEYGIMSIPCVMVFKGGELVGKNIGFVPKDALKEFIDANI